LRPKYFIIKKAMAGPVTSLDAAIKILDFTFFVFNVLSAIPSEVRY
jgi:hypothetical protein